MVPGLYTWATILSSIVMVIEPAASCSSSSVGSLMVTPLVEWKNVITVAMLQEAGISYLSNMAKVEATSPLTPTRHVLLPRLVLNWSVSSSYITAGMATKERLHEYLKSC